MAFYELGKSEHVKCDLSARRLAAAEVYVSEGKGEFAVLLFENGCVGVFEAAKWQLRGSVVLTCNQKRIMHVLKAKTLQNIMIVQTFKQLYLVDISAVSDFALCNNHANFESNIVKIAQREDWLSTMTNIHLKLVKQQDKVCLKVVGREKQQIAYSFYEVSIATATLTLIQQYKHSFPNEFKVSLQSKDKDIIICQSTVSKFKPIKVALLSYFSHQSSHDTAILEHHEIMQFQQHCFVSSIFKIGKDILCIVTGSHLQADCQSNIILFNCHLRQTINNITIKDVMIFETNIFYVNSNDISFDCFAKQDSKDFTLQVFPFCFFPHFPKEIPASDSHFSSPNSLILHNESTQQLAILPKISKKAIYQSWLRVHFSRYSSLFQSVLALLD